MLSASRPDLSAAAWRKSSYSNQEGGECVEVSDGHTDLVPVRDSKTPNGPTLAFPHQAWTTFITGVKADRFTC